MTNQEIVVPFALPPAEHAKDLLSALNVPALATLLSRGRVTKRDTGAAFAPAVAHESWLAKSGANSPPLARLLMQELGIEPDDGTWFVLQPASFHIARDHLVLTDWRQLAITESESKQLFQSALDLCTESGFRLVYGNAQLWFLRADPWRGLTTSSPDAACGHNIEIWLPKGERERDWRRLQNELQMLWHMHAINEQREQHGRLRINTAWLWGGSTKEDRDTSGLEALARSLLGATPDSRATAPVLLLDQLIAPALCGDWSQWLARYAALDAEYFTPLSETIVRNGNGLSLVFTDSNRLMQLQVGRNSMRKFWCKPSLKRLTA